MAFKHAHVGKGEIWMLVLKKDKQRVEVEIEDKVEDVGVLTFVLLDPEGNNIIVSEFDNGYSVGDWYLEPVTAGASSPEVSEKSVVPFQPQSCLSENGWAQLARGQRGVFGKQ